MPQAAALHRRDEERLSLAFRALGDPSRRRILELLRRAGRLNVGAVANTFDMSLNGVSKHLKVLEGAGLITREVQGRDHWIRVDPAALAAPQAWLEFHTSFWNDRLNALADHFSATPTAATPKTRRKRK